VVHRDLKPDNVMIGPFGEVVVMDWGLAKNLGVPAEEGAPAAEPPEGAAEPVTAPGATLDHAIMGTLGFMAPEQAGGRSNQADERTDIYALGAILYSILVLHPPIRGQEAGLMLDRTRTGDIRPPTDYNRGASREVTAIPLPHCPGRRVPRVLSSVAMKALALEAANRYQTVGELQSDITAYQAGFATSVEQAGRLRQSYLLFKRHKAISISTALLFVFAFGFVFQTVQSNRRLRATLRELTATAPSFYERARLLVDDQNFKEALDRINYATSLAPTNAAYHELRGNILQTMLRLEEARAAYAEALQLAPSLRTAATNRALCDKLLAANVGGGAWPTGSLLELQTAMQEQGRPAEALSLSPMLKQEKQKIFDSWKARLEAAGISTQRFTFSDSGLDLRLTMEDSISDAGLGAMRGMPLVGLTIENGTNITTVSPLKGMPLTWLSLGLTRVKDVAPLQGMTSLRRLEIGFAPVSDLSPLKGMRLTALVANNTAIRDLTPLQGMPLVQLNVGSTPVRDLTPLRGLPLTDLVLGYTRVSDLAPLVGMPLQHLELIETRVTSLAPLAGMPLKHLRLQGLSISDLAPLKGMQLNTLGLFGTKVSDLGILQGMPMETLELNGKLISDIRVFRGMPLKFLYLKATAVKDFSPLRGLPLSYLTVEESAFSDTRLLEGMPLKTLVLRGTRVADLAALNSLALLTSLDLSSTPVVEITPLRGLRLDRLWLDGTGITNISVLAGLPLKQLTLHGCQNLHDVSPLAACRQLEGLSLPLTATNVDTLRSLPALRSLSYTAPKSGWPDNAAEFWKALEARRPPRK
jgi:Leucine-rich repeat (LRR) protein/tetratricopeptide (TPR) repeat protein